MYRFAAYLSLLCYLFAWSSTLGHVHLDRFAVRSDEVRQHRSSNGLEAHPDHTHAGHAHPSGCCGHHHVATTKPQAEPEDSQQCPVHPHGHTPHDSADDCQLCDHLGQPAALLTLLSPIDWETSLAPLVAIAPVRAWSASPAVFAARGPPSLV